jgi:hypothetical protein
VGGARAQARALPHRAADTLDRIDEIVRPGVNVNPADTSYGDQVLAPELRRAEEASS